MLTKEYIYLENETENIKNVVAMLTIDANEYRYCNNLHHRLNMQVTQLSASR